MFLNFNNLHYLVKVQFLPFNLVLIPSLWMHYLAGLSNVPQSLVGVVVAVSNAVSDFRSAPIVNRQSSSVYAFDRIKSLEAQLASALARVPSAPQDHDEASSRTLPAHGQNETIPSQSLVPSESHNLVEQNPPPKTHALSQRASPAPATPERSPIHPSTSGASVPHRSHIADAVGFIALGEKVGREPAYVGSSSGFSIATDLGQIVQATVWTKALSSTISDQQPKALSLEDLKNGSASPPSYEMGIRILNAYFQKIHPRYPIFERSDIFELHAKRQQQTNSNTQEQFGTFKLYMVYAIGATILQLTETYSYTPPEKFFMAALQYISAARESHSIYNIEAMILLVVYNLRSPSNSGIWYMIGLAMRTCIELGLHREMHYNNISPYKGQVRRRLFWSVYFLERVVALSLGRPYSISDRDIDTNLPCDFDDSIHDDIFISEILKNPSETRPASNLTMFIALIQLKRLESQIQTNIYRVDKPVSSLFLEVNPLLSAIQDWERSLPSLTESEDDYLHLQYNKAVRLLLQPFLGILDPADKLVGICLHASGQICEIFKRLHQRDSYGHSFIAVHSIFLAGITICYCLFLAPTLWTISVANDLRACSSVLFVMAERTSTVKKYRDVLETVIKSAMDFVAKPSMPQTTHSYNHRRSRKTNSTQDQQIIQSLLRLSAQQAPTNIPAPQRGPRHESANARQTRMQDFSPNSTLNTSTGAYEPPLEAARPFAAYDEFGDSLHNGVMQDQGLDPMGFSQQQPMGSTPTTWEGDKFSVQMLNEMLVLDSEQQ
ncbi:hypothetical protein B7463_g5916, partial [Scytalidium lignicola]